MSGTDAVIQSAPASGSPDHGQGGSLSLSGGGQVPRAWIMGHELPIHRTEMMWERRNNIAVEAEVGDASYQGLNGKCAEDSLWKHMATPVLFLRGLPLLHLSLAEKRPR